MGKFAAGTAAAHAGKMPATLSCIVLLGTSRWGVSQRMRRSGLQKLFNSEIAIPKNGSKKAGADLLSGMHGHEGSPATGMAKEMVASSNANYIKPQFSEHPNRLASGEAGKTGHEPTAIRCTPTNSCPDPTS